MLVGELAGNKFVFADSKGTESQWRIDDGNGCMNLSTENYASALIAPGVTQHSSYEEHLSLMTEIQLRRIVDRLSLKESDQRADGDEEMMRDGHIISKFSKEAMHVENVHGKIKDRINRGSARDYRSLFW